MEAGEEEGHQAKGEEGEIVEAQEIKVLKRKEMQYRITQDQKKTTQKSHLSVKSEHLRLFPELLHAAPAHPCGGDDVEDGGDEERQEDAGEELRLGFLSLFQEEEVAAILGWPA